MPYSCHLLPHVVQLLFVATEVVATEVVATYRTVAICCH